MSVAPDDWDAWWRKHGERELRCILMVAWDPVGSAVSAEAWDEYDSYLAHVGAQLRDTLSDDEAERVVARYLEDVERDAMGLTAGPRRRPDLERIASAIVAWREWSFTHGGRPPGEWPAD